MRKRTLELVSAGDAVALPLVPSGIFFAFSIFIFSLATHAQVVFHRMPSQKSNFSSFTSVHRSPEQLQQLRKRFGNLPMDADFLDKQIPSAHVTEIFGRRTADSKYYVDDDSPSVVYIRKSMGAMNFQKQGQWLTIDERFEPKTEGIIEASHLEEPVGFDLAKKSSYIRSLHGTIFFNHWALYGIKSGKEVLLARPDWSHYTAGDDGIYINNIFPGIDAGMQLFSYGLKTNFIVHRNQFPGYAFYVLRDFFSGEEPGLINSPAPQAGPVAGTVSYAVNGEPVLRLEKGYMYTRSDAPDHYRIVPYRNSQHELSMVIRAEDLDKLLSVSDVIIDPFVSFINSISKADITGSQFNADCSMTNTCDYNMVIGGLRGIQVTDVRYSFSYLATPPCMAKDGSFNILSGGCGPKNITATTPDAYGPIVANDVSVFSDFSGNCFPTPSCATQSIQFTFQFARSCKGAAGCDGSCIGAISPFSVLIRGTVVLNVPIVQAAPSASSVCSGEPVTFTAMPVNGGATPAYQWLFNGLPVGTNGDVYVNSTLASTDSVSVIMVSSLNTGCPGNADTSTAVHITVDPTPTLHVTASDSDICAGENVQFTAATTQAGDAPVFQWLVNGQPAGSNAPAFSSSTLSQDDVVSAIVTAATGCAKPVASDNVVNMTVRNVPGINPGPDFAIELGDSVRLQSTVSGDIASYLWSPPTGLSDPSILNPIASPESTTGYQLTVTEQSGCMAGAAVLVKVLQPFKMPNAFTPNLDGKNDVFRVPAGGLLSMDDFSIYNRWGQRVFFTKDPGQGWDGNLNGQPCSTGTYVYVIHGADLKGKVSLKGTVTLIR